MTIKLAETERDVVPAGRVAIWGLGGPSVAIRTPEAILYVDMFTGPSPREDLTKLTPDLDPDEVRRADAALCTHVHKDHCHERSLRSLYENTGALFLAPKSCCDEMRTWGFSQDRVVELAPGQQLTVKGVLITAVPTRDWTDAHAIGFVLQVQGVTLYDGGDCLYDSYFREIGRRWEIDAALINYAGNPSPDQAPFMEPEEVVQAAKDLRAGRILLKHWDLWQSMAAEPAPMVDLLAAAGINAVALAQGDRVVVP